MAENIKVICRVRPLNTSELARGDKCVVAFPGDGKTQISLGKTYTFDHVFQAKSAQNDVYEVAAKPIVADVLNGYNGTIFAYGQTASGKTFTMEGLLGDPVYQGIIPRIIHDIFNHIYTMDENLEFHIKVSYFEIYLDKIRDLLDISKTNLSVHEDKDRVPYVKGATERFVSNPEEVFDVIDEGKANRHVSVTNMNEHSSRSHSIFMITVRQENLETQKKLHGKLYLVDLAGSEKVAKTGAEGTVLDEAKNINKSLSALGNVINSLVECTHHVPYRDSKLTRILQESLGGNARTTMIICCSPAAFNEAETKSTLLFGLRAKTIKNMVMVNEELTADEWRRRFEREREKVRRLQAIVAKLQLELKRWRAGESVSSTDWTAECDAAVEEFTEEAPSKVPSTIAALPAPGAEPSATGAIGLPSKTLPAANASGVAAAGLEQVASEEQLHALYQQLDDKDDEINKQAQTIARLRQQMDEQDELLKALRFDNDNKMAEISGLQTESHSSKEEVKEVLQALEELAMNFDQKAHELDLRNGEFEEAQEQLSKRLSVLQTKDGELQQLRDTHTSHRKKYADTLSSLLREMVDVGESMSDQLTKPAFGGTERLDEELAVMRLYLSKMKTEAKSLHSRVRQLEEERVQHVQLMRKSEEESRDYGVRVHELEAKVIMLTDKSEHSDSRKRQLQDMVDNLTAEIAKLRANEKLLAGAGAYNKQILDGQSEIREKLDEEFKRHSQQYAQQLKSLRDELDDKQRKLEAFKDDVNRLTYQRDNMQEECKRLQDELQLKSGRLEKLENAAEKRNVAKQDLQVLEETVVKELQNLHILRRLFVQDLKKRIKKSSTRLAAADATVNQTGEGNDKSLASNPEFERLLLVDEEETNHWGSSAQRDKILFLENNLEKLTSIHKQLIHDNAELRCELPKLEKRLKGMAERVNNLEKSLKEAKEAAMRDRKRYQHEVERIKDAVKQRSMARRGQSAQIAKPIRAGQHPLIGSPMGAPVNTGVAR